MLTLPVSVPAYGEQIEVALLPSSLNTLELQADSAHFTDNAFGMSNQALRDFVDSLHDNTIGMTQRRLNYQWLQFYANPKEFAPATGGRALNRILKMGWQTYRENHQSNQQHFLFRYMRGQGKLGSALDYDLRLSDDELKLSFEYAF
ncbi:MAG: hypothetical protein K0U59_03165 [Gammaproteobacteria bacterium]|nr:hypothetical protein [Gammaproteobacteria bacterium]